MKLIEATISEDKIAQVCDVINDYVATYHIVRGEGKCTGKKKIMRARRGTETFELSYNKMAMISFVISDGLAEKIVSTIADAAFTGDIADGTITIQSIDYVMNIGSKTKEIAPL